MLHKNNGESSTAFIFHRARANILIILSGSGAAMLLGFATAALNARVIGPEGIGVIALFQASALLMTGLFSFGTQQPLIRLGKQAIHDGNHQRLGAIGTIAISLDYISSTIAGLASIILVTMFSDRIKLDAEMVPIAQIYTAVVFFSGISAANGIFRLFNLFHYFALAQTANAAALLGCSLAFFFINAPLHWYLISFAAVNIITAQAQVMLAARLMRDNGATLKKPLESLSFSGLTREFFSYAWTTNLTGIVNSLRMNGESILLGAMFGAATVGIYNVVRQIAGVFNKIAAAASTAIFPEVSDLASRRDYRLARKLLNRSATFGFSLGLVGAVALLVFGKPMLNTAFGPQFSDGYPTLVLMGFAGAIALSGATFGGFVQAFSSPVRLLQLYILSFGVYAIAAPFLIYQFGLVGAPAAQIAFSLALWLGCWLLLRKVFDVQKFIEERTHGG